MLQNSIGAIDGIHVEKFQVGKEYNLNESLADVFVTQMKVAEYVDEEDAPIDYEPEKNIVEEKMVLESPENKMEEKVSENKDYSTTVSRKSRFSRKK